MLRVLATAVVTVMAIHISPWLPARLAAQPPQDTASVARIARIAASIRGVSRTGADSGESRTLAARMVELDVPGVSIAVFDDGRIAWARAWGVRDVTTGEPVDTLTLFQAASISKPVAAVGMFRLAEQGRVDVDADVNTMLRRWKLPAGRFGASGRATLRQIVSHMAGLTVSGFRGYAKGDPLPTLPQILDGVPPANSPPVRFDTIPGVEERYSGGGVTVMQLLLEDVTGRRFDTLMEELVLSPLGMTRSTFAIEPSGRLARNVAHGHLDDGTTVSGGYRLHPESAAAGLWTTPSDLARFMLAVGRAYRGESPALLTRATARTILTRVPGGSGLGFGLSGADSTFRYRHSGGNSGFRAFAVAFAGSGRGAVVMTNADNGSTLYREILNAISREYDWPSMNLGAP